MTVRILRRQAGSTDLEEIATVTDGDVDGSDLSALWSDGVPSEDELVARFDGPVLFAARAGDAEAEGSGPLSHIPNVPDSPDVLTRSMLQEIVRWKAGQVADDADGVTVSVGQQYDAEAARPVEAGSEFSRHFNPSIHPRDPDTGKFVERPFDFDLDQRTLDNTPTPDLLEFLQDEGEPVDQWIAGDQLSIDGIPNDAESLDDAREKIRERGTPDVSIPEDVPDTESDEIPEGLDIHSRDDLLDVWQNGWDQTEDFSPEDDLNVSLRQFAELVAEKEEEMSGMIDTTGAAGIVANELREDVVDTPSVSDTDGIPPEALGDRMPINERRELEPGDTILLEQAKKPVAVGNVVENDGAKLTVDEGDETNVYPISNFVTRPVDPGAVPSREEQELGVKPPDFDTTPDEPADAGFNQRVQVSDDARAIAQDIVDMVDDVGTVPPLSSDAARDTREGARAGASPESTGDMEAEAFPQLKNQMSQALQQAFRRHDDVPNQAAKEVLRNLDEMKGKSYSDYGKTFENALQDRIDLPGDLRNDGKNVLPTGDNREYKHAAEVLTALSQEIFTELHGDERELHRGLQTTGGAKLVNGILQSDPDADGTFTFSENVIANYSAAENVAQDFARSAWVTRDAQVDDVAHVSDDILGSRSSFRGEGEIALGTGESTVPYDAVKIKSSAGEGVLTVSDLFDSDPSDLGVAEMNNVNDLLQWLNKRDVPIPDQSDVPDNMQDWLDGWVERQASTIVVSMHSDTRAVLRQVLGNDRFEEARERGS